jgi:D-glycero-D-manno-heptose 1,7-bisphosphate phosphatase
MAHHNGIPDFAYTGRNGRRQNSEHMVSTNAKALFLDRDGIINVERDYVHKPDDFTFSAGIFDLCRAAHQAGFLLVVITNQAGIARGLYTEEDFAAITQWMIGKFADEGIPIAKVYHSPYHPEATIDRYRLAHADRKPSPGMILRARDDLRLDLSASILIGDRLTDIEAGRRAGIPRLCLIPHTSAAEAIAANDETLRGVLISQSLDEARQALFA